KLILIETANIILNSKYINKYNENNENVNIHLTKEEIRIEDNAKGISYENIYNSLLIPSSSTKFREIDNDESYQTYIIPNEYNMKSFNIVINKIIIVTIKTELIINDYDSYYIEMPIDTKL